MRGGGSSPPDGRDVQCVRRLTEIIGERRKYVEVIA